MKKSVLLMIGLIGVSLACHGAWIMVLHPNDKNLFLKKGAKYTIDWVLCGSQCDCSDTLVTIELYRGGKLPQNKVGIIAKDLVLGPLHGVPVTPSGSFKWKVGQLIGPAQVIIKSKIGYYIRVVSQSIPNMQDFSDYPFRIGITNTIFP